MVSMTADEGGEPRTVQARHVEVEKDEAGLQGGPEAVHGVKAIDGGHHGAAESLETSGQRVSESGVVIHQQNATLARMA